MDYKIDQIIKKRRRKIKNKSHHINTPSSTQKDNHKRKKVQHTSNLMASERALRDRIRFEKNFEVKTLNLSQEDEKIYRNNPHLRELFANKIW